jgi:hypothetical protein
MSGKQKRYHIYINYFIQNDSWESISHPNLFVLPQEFSNLNDVKAQMVYDNFPLKNKQNFYLRFFLDDKSQGVKGWVDFPPSAIIPIYNDGHVYVKVLRLPKDVKINFKNDDLNKQKEASSNKSNTDNLIFMDSQQPKPPQTQPQQNTNSAFGQDMFSDLNKELNNMGNINPNLNSNGGQMPNPQPSQPPAENVNMNSINENPQQNFQNNNTNQNTFNLGDWNAFEVNSGPNGVNMDSNSQNNSSKDINQVDPNLFNVFNNMNMAQTQNQSQVIEAPNYDFTANMDPKKNKLYQIDKISNTLPDDDIKAQVDPIINKWILGGEGQKNLLFLLTTLHEVWTNSKLTIPDMQTLVNDKAAVRTWYKKAMRELHADKNRDKDFKTRYIAASLYQILNEANSNY